MGAQADHSRVGARGDLYAAARTPCESRSTLPHFDFSLAHSAWGASVMSSHLTGKGVVPYPGHRRDLPREKRQGVAIETHAICMHPKRGSSNSENTLSRSRRADGKGSSIIAVAARGPGFDRFETEWPSAESDESTDNKAPQSSQNSDKSSTLKLGE